jgi:uncharacterized protein (TIRG00374 family)
MSEPCQVYQNGVPNPCREMDRKQAVGYLIATVLFAGMLYLADFGDLYGALHSVEEGYLVLAFLVGGLSFVAWSLAWRSILDVVGGVLGSFEVYKIFAASMFVNNVTPMGYVGGQPLAAYALSKRSGIRYERTLAAIMSADVMAVVPSVLFILVSTLYLAVVGRLSSAVLDVFRMVVTVSLLMAGPLYLIWFRFDIVEEGVMQLFDRWSRFGDRAEERSRAVLKEVRETFRILFGQPVNVVQPFLWAHLTYVLRLVTLSILLVSFGVTDGLFWAVFVLPVAGLSKGAPTPGGSGTFELVMAGLLTTFYPVSFTVAVMVAVLFRACTYWQVTVVGYLSMMTLDYDWRE